MRVAMLAVVVVAAAAGRAHAGAAVHAQLACTTADGAPIGPTSRLDGEIACAITGDTGGLAGRVVATVSRPLRTSTATRAGLTATWIGDELLRCAATTFRAELARDGAPVWSSSLVVRPACPRPRPRVVARLECKTITVIDTVLDGGDDHPDAPSPAEPPAARPRSFHLLETCRVTIARPPALASVVATIHRADDAAVPVDLPLTADGDGGVTAKQAVPPEAKRPCRRVRVDAEVSAGGQALWTGHTTFSPWCP